MLPWCIMGPVDNNYVMQSMYIKPGLILTDGDAALQTRQAPGQGTELFIISMTTAIKFSHQPEFA